MQMGAVRASGDLKRRGIEVDHGLYLENESESQFGTDAAPTTAPPQTINTEPSVRESSVEMHSSESPQVKTESIELESKVRQLEQTHEQLMVDNRELSEQVNRLEETVRQLSEQLDDLKQQLGV
jgi:chromosome segregation ATPase